MSDKKLNRLSTVDNAPLSSFWLHSAAVTWMVMESQTTMRAAFMELAHSCRTQMEMEPMTMTKYMQGHRQRIKLMTSQSRIWQLLPTKPIPSSHGAQSQTDFTQSTHTPTCYRTGHPLQSTRSKVMAPLSLTRIVCKVAQGILSWALS